jgi:hypothetical protein
MALALLKYLGKALVKCLGNAVGFGVAGDLVIEVGEEVWKDWNQEKDERQKRAELEALAQSARDDCRRQVEEVVREVAAGIPQEVQRLVAQYLEQVPDQVRRVLGRPDDPGGTSVPPGLRLQRPADLLPFLSGGTLASAAGAPACRPCRRRACRRSFSQRAAGPIGRQ